MHVHTYCTRQGLGGVWCSCHSTCLLSYSVMLQAHLCLPHLICVRSGRCKKPCPKT